MPFALAKDGTQLHFEETGRGTPIIFVHEFAGDQRSWEPQVRYFSRGYRCITFNARGYPPSSVPNDVAAYSQSHACEDIIAVLDHLEIPSAHIVGLSMGGFATLHVGLRHPSRAQSLVIAGCGYGAEPGQKERFRAESEGVAQQFEQRGMAYVAARYALGPARVQLQNKDPRGWQEFATQLAEHSAVGSALTMRGVQMRRPSLWELTEQIKQIQTPTLIVNGDEDEPCLEPGLFLKRNIASSALVVLLRTGHTLNLEEPDAFNRALMEFFHAVAARSWTNRDPRSQAQSIMTSDTK